MSRIRSCALAMLAVTAATPLLAQASSPALEVRAGVGTSSGGSYRDRTGLVLDATLASRTTRTSRPSRILAVSGGVQGTPAQSDVCVLAPDGSCVPSSPLFLSLAALAGLEWGHGRGPALRTLAGPAYYRDVRRPGGGALGLQARVDLAKPARGRIALVASLQGALLPSFHGDAHALGSAGLGIRIQ